MTSTRCVRPKLIRFSLSLFVVVHLAAVSLPPLSLQARGPLGVSPIIAWMLAPLDAYCQFLYLDRGYAFFAPDPGPSHLIQVAVSDGEKVTDEVFYPDLQSQKPRLLYHRHLMLTEYLHEIYRPRVQSGTGLPSEDSSRWIEERDRYEQVRHSFLRHLQHVYEGKQVSLRRIEHRLPNLELYREHPLPLDHVDSYRVLADTPMTLPPSQWQGNDENGLRANLNFKNQVRQPTIVEDQNFTPSPSPSEIVSGEER